jgi:CO dehydrogenase nickel-insertion accessory protein CooC1
MTGPGEKGNMVFRVVKLYHFTCPIFQQKILKRAQKQESRVHTWVLGSKGNSDSNCHCRSPIWTRQFLNKLF